MGLSREEGCRGRGPRGGGASGPEASRRLDLAELLRRNPVPTISVVLALVTCAFVPPDAGYAEYVDWGTLGRIACVLVTVAGMHGSGAFQWLAAWLTRLCRGARGIALVLVGVTALASMFVTNDMALLALLPLSAACLTTAGRGDLVAPVFVLQGVAANLCGMLLPFGNPQNIYLTGFYGIDFGAFLGTMAPPFALSTVAVAAGCALLVPRGDLRAPGVSPELRTGRVLVFGALLVVCVLTILGAIPTWVALVVVLAGSLAVDRAALRGAGWGLMVTFAAFFVFSGNLARIDVVRDLFASWLAGGAFVPAALLSQVISNVPAAVVLSRFTDDWGGLLVGVNVGGAGTPVASLATLIVITQYVALARSPLGAGGRALADEGAEPDEGIEPGERAWPNGGTDAIGSPAFRLAPTSRFMALLVGVNVVLLVALLAVGVALGW